MAIAKQAKLAVESLVVDEPHQNPRQNRAPALAFRARKTRHQRCVIRSHKRLHEIEDGMPKARLDCRALLIVGDILLRELREDRLETRVDFQQRLHLRGADFLARARKSGDQLERFLLNRHRIARRQLGDPAIRVSRIAEWVRERPDPRVHRFDHYASGSSGTLHSGVATVRRPSCWRSGSNRCGGIPGGRRRDRRRQCRETSASSCRQS